LEFEAAVDVVGLPVGVGDWGKAVGAGVELWVGVAGFDDEDGKFGAITPGIAVPPVIIALSGYPSLSSVPKKL